jgi:hypothetical protein|tara:strand:+ start:620 stop:739 length:120 start_codon:yes stop_codon:yes gene_type:complete
MYLLLLKNLRASVIVSVINAFMASIKMQGFLNQKMVIAR